MSHKRGRLGQSNGGRKMASHRLHTATLPFPLCCPVSQRGCCEASGSRALTVLLSLLAHLEYPTSDVWLELNLPWVLVSPPPLAHAEGRCPLGSLARRQFGSWTVTTTLRFCCQGLCHICACPAWLVPPPLPAPIVFS